MTATAIPETDHMVRYVRWGLLHNGRPDGNAFVRRLLVGLALEEVPDVLVIAERDEVIRRSRRGTAPAPGPPHSRISRLQIADQDLWTMVDIRPDHQGRVRA